MRTAFFPPKVLQSLPGDSTEALAVLCGEFERFDGHARQLPEHHDDYVEAVSILRAFGMARDVKLPAFPEITSNRRKNITDLAAYFTQLRDSVRADLAMRHSRGYFESKTEEYMALFAKAPAYEFSEGDFKRVQTLIAELREMIRSSSLIADDHKRRLLRKLEAMASELTRKTSDIDRFWGFIGEAGVAMRKFGEDLQPISQRVIELGGLVVGVILTREGIKALPEVSRILLPEQPAHSN